MPAFFFISEKKIFCTYFVFLHLVFTNIFSVKASKHFKNCFPQKTDKLGF